MALNEKRIGTQIFAPDWTDYNKRVRYQVYDLTALLHSNGNTLAAMVGNGWYFYPRPIYPYPYPYAPPTVVTPPPTVQYYYYCGNPAGYYPYVPQCFGPWSEVPVR